MNVYIKRVVLAGVVGTAVMTVVSTFVAPMMGMPKMNPADMLAGQMGGMIVLGWLAHFMIGVTLAGIYAIVASRLPGPVAVRGALYGVAPWLLAQIAVMPMMGMPLFSGSMVMAGGSLLARISHE